MAETRTEPFVLPFSLLVYREEVAGVGGVWFACSVFTGQFAHGDTPEDCLAGLMEAISTALRCAITHGMTPARWLADQLPVEAELVEEYRRLASVGPQEPRQTRLEREGVILGASVVFRDAA